MSLISSNLNTFKVTRHQPELVVPSAPTPRELKRLSDIDDQQALRFQIPFVFFYKNKKGSQSQTIDPVRVVRDGLGRALVHYYPLAGRLREGLNGKLFVDCNAEGVLFIEAVANIGLDQLGDRILSPSSFLDDVLYNVPGSDGIVGCPLFLIQVTRLLCGGFILAIRMNRTISDGFGLSQFLKTVSEMGRGLSVVPSVPPVWKREIFDARDPPRVTCEHHEYEETEIIDDDQAINVNIDLIQRSFLVTPDFMNRLRKKLPKHLVENCSSLELLTACFWKCRTRALKLDDDEVVYISLTVTARGRLAEKLPRGFYGSSACFPAAVSTAKLLDKSPLSYAVELVKDAKSKMGEDYIRSVAFLMATSSSSKRRPGLKTNNIAISDTRMAGLGNVDFGWGPASYAGPAKATSFLTTFSKYKNGELGREGIVLHVCLPAPAMLRFELEMKKMVWEPWNNKYNGMSVAKIISML